MLREARRKGSIKCQGCGGRRREAAKEVLREISGRYDGNSEREDQHQGRQSRKKERYEAWSEKVMHGQFERQTKEIRSEESWMWLQRGTLKRETESLITAAQEQALRTNYRRAKIEKDGTSPLCRMCKQADETVSHIVSECGKMAQSEYKGRHDKVATAVHWGLAKKHGLERSEQWYQQRLKRSVRMTK